MNTTLPKYFIVITTSLLLLPLLFALSSQFVFSAADHVLINEVQIAGAVADDEFVELYNPTSSDIVMENWRLTRMTQIGTESNLVSDIDGTIPANGYFLIAPDEYDGVVTRDIAYSTSGRLATNNSVALYSDAGVTRVDLVGMGIATVFEGSSTVEVPPTDGSIQRVNDDDNDDNATDFAAQTVSDPQNTAIQVVPSPTTTSSPTMTATPTATATSSPTSSPSPTPTSTATASPTASPTVSPTGSPSPTASPSPSATPRSIATFRFPNMNCAMEIRYLRFGFFRVPFAMMVCERI